MSISSIPPNLTLRSTARKWVVRAGFGLTILIVVTLIVLLNASGMSMYLGGLVLAAAFALVFWLRPYWGMLALVAFGTAHSFLMMLFLRVADSPALLRAMQLWKELVLLVLLVRAIEQTFRRGRVPKIYLLDLAIIVFIGIAGLYLVVPSSLPGTTVFSKALGLRADTFFLVAYFVSRLLDLNRGQVRTLIISFSVITIIVVAVAAIQFAAPEVSSSIFNQLGFQDYMFVQRGDLAVDSAVRDREIAGVNLPRASSILLSDLVLSFFALLAAPLATALFLQADGPLRKTLAAILMIGAIGITFLTVTRSSIVALIPSLGFMAVFSRRYLSSAFLLLQAVVAVFLIAAVAGITPETFGDIFSPDEASITGHIRAIEESLQIIQEEPWGRGLGTAGQVAQRTRPQGAITNESWYLQIATEIGLVPAMIYLFIVAATAIIAFDRYRWVTDPWIRSLCLGLGGSALALGLVGFVLHAWEGLTVSIIFWLFAGMVVRATDLDKL